MLVDDRGSLAVVTIRAIRSRSPVIVGGGKRALPDDVNCQLKLLAEHRFENGVVHLRYGLSGVPPDNHRLVP